MQNVSVIFNRVRQLLHSDEFKVRHSISDKDFTRKCILSFKVTFLIILNGIKKTTSIEIYTFLNLCNSKEVEKSAFCKARLKLSSESFIELNDLMVKEFYSNMVLKKYSGRLVLAIDGSVHQLPNHPAVIEHFGFVSNQNENFKMPVARVSQLYDVNNKLIVDSLIFPYSIGERDLAIMHLEKIKLLREIMDEFNDCVVIFDRGYPSMSLILYCLLNKIHFLMRCNTQFISEVNNVVKSDSNDETIEFNLNDLHYDTKQELKINFNNINLKQTVKFRVVIVILETGEKEILLTSLIDEEFEFKEFYFKRWPIETSYGFQKVNAEVENFSGKSILSIQQDFQACVFIANATQLLAMESKRELDEKKLKKRKYEYQPNSNIALGLMKNQFVKMLIDCSQDVDQFCEKVKKSMKKNTEPIRPCRKVKRNKMYSCRKFHMNKRSCR